MKQRIFWKQTHEPVRVGDGFTHEEGIAKVIEITQDWRILIQFNDPKIRPLYRLLELDEAQAYSLLDSDKAPPQGLRPRFMWIAPRLDEIREAIERYEAAHVPVPRAWRIELAALQGTVFSTEPQPDVTSIEKLEYEPAYSSERLDVLRAAAAPFAADIMPLEVECIDKHIVDIDSGLTLMTVGDPVMQKLIALFLNNTKNLLRKK